MFEFPYKSKNYPKNDLEKEITLRVNNLKKFKFEDRIILQESQVKNLPKLDEGKYRKYKKYDDNYVILVGLKNDYDDFNILSDLFNEKCRMKCKVAGHPISPYDFYEQNMEKVRKYALNKYHRINNHTLRESIYEILRTGECTSHSPKNIIAMMQIFNSKKILDPSAGWGDRLIGALAGNCDYYCGVDPNECVHETYKIIINHFKAQDKVKLINEPFEDAILPDIEFDLVYTSPPYFDMEIYTDKTNQSLYKYDNQQVWFNKFLKVLLTKSIKYLRIGGILAVNINQKKDAEYVYQMLDFMDNYKEAKYVGTIFYANEDLKNPQPIFIWKKTLHEITS